MKNRIKKLGGIIAILLVTIACSNSNSKSNAISAEKRKSFSENIMYKTLKKYDEFAFVDKEEDFKKNEYQNIEELLDDNYPTWREKLDTEWYQGEKKITKNIIDEAENITSSKFFLQRREGYSDNILFTPKENSGFDLCVIYCKGNLGLMSLKKVRIKDFVKESSLYQLKLNMRDSVDIKSLGLDKETTDKLLEAQNSNQ